MESTKLVQIRGQKESSKTTSSCCALIVTVIVQQNAQGFPDLAEEAYVTTYVVVCRFYSIICDCEKAVFDLNDFRVI